MQWSSLSATFGATNGSETLVTCAFSECHHKQWLTQKPHQQTRFSSLCWNRNVQFSHLLPRCCCRAHCHLNATEANTLRPNYSEVSQITPTAPPNTHGLGPETRVCQDTQAACTACVFFGFVWVCSLFWGTSALRVCLLESYQHTHTDTQVFEVNYPCAKGTESDVNIPHSTTHTDIHMSWPLSWGGFRRCHRLSE